MMNLMICGDKLGINIHPNLIMIHLHKKLESWDFGSTNVEKCNMCGEKFGAHRGRLEFFFFLIAKFIEEFQNSPLGKAHPLTKFGKSYYC